MKKCAITIILSVMAGLGFVPAGSGAERTEAILPDVGGAVSLEGYDIERVVDAVAKAMSDAAHGDLELAAQQYRKVRLLAPDYVEVHYREGVALKKLGRYAEAVERMERQVALDPVWPEAWRELAWLYAESGDKAKADEAGRRAVEAEAAWGRTRASS